MQCFLMLILLLWHFFFPWSIFPLCFCFFCVSWGFHFFYFFFPSLHISIFLVNFSSMPLTSSITLLSAISWVKFNCLIVYPKSHLSCFPKKLLKSSFGLLHDSSSLSSVVEGLWCFGWDFCHAFHISCVSMMQCAYFLLFHMVCTAFSRKLSSQTTQRGDRGYTSNNTKW